MTKSAYEWAVEALHAVAPVKQTAESLNQARSSFAFQPEAIFECAVSPGVANKKLSPAQLIAIAEVAGDRGEIEYTPHHQIILRIPTAHPEKVVEQLKQVGLLTMPVGDVVQVKACDFCNGEKFESIPHAEEIHQRLGGMEVPKELKIGINGCGMTCYSAVNEDIGIVYRKGKFDLFLGAKTVGRNAHAGTLVAEGIEPEKIVSVIERIVTRFKQEAFPNERFHKFFKRKGELEGFTYLETKVLLEEAACGE